PMRGPPTGAERRQVGFGPDYRPAVYGPEFRHAARPGHVITGTVTDAATGRPVAGVTVVGTAGSIDQFRDEAWHDAVEAVTDAAGRFRLGGLPKGKVRYLPLKAGGQPYLDRLVQGKETKGPGPGAG